MTHGTEEGKEQEEPVIQAGAVDGKRAAARQEGYYDPDDYPIDAPFHPGSTFPPAPGFSPDRLLDDMGALLTELSDCLDAVTEYLGVQIVPVEEVMPRGPYVAIKDEETEGETDGE